MRCLYCRQWAGLIRRTCPVCARIIRIVEQAGPAVGLVGLVDIFAAEGLTREQVDASLRYQIMEVVDGIRWINRPAFALIVLDYKREQVEPIGTR